MHVVATAGHVDHGKSTLVKALTGSEPDRLAEERRRGLSIELGYCWTDLSDLRAAGVDEVAFVDVPGHQRFITTALAGMGPVPVVMFVVAADDRWMPQAAEHLAALAALGVDRGLLVVTRADLADPGPALAAARGELARTALAGAPEVVVSGRTGAGVPELRALLGRVLATVPRPDPHADVRLWVDRRFHVKGAGTVVTGTLPAGTVAVGGRLELAGTGAQVRVRGLEALARSRGSVSGVARVALDLGGRAPAALGRGTALVTPGGYDATAVVDVEVRGPGVPPERPVLHVGSAACAVHARPLGERHARLLLSERLPLRAGDRALLRDPGSRTVWGVRVLDPAPARFTRRGAAARRARDLAALDGTMEAELEIRGLVRRTDLRRWGLPAGPPPPGTVGAGDWLVAPARAAELREALHRLVRAAGQPLAATTAATRLGLPDDSLVAALATPPLRVQHGRVYDDTAGESLPDEAGQVLERLSELLSDTPFAAPDADLLAGLGLDDRTAARLHQAGALLRLAPGVVLLPGADRVALTTLAGLDQPFTASAARQALGTSRRVVLPLLAHLDRTGRTVRLPDDRRRVRLSRHPAPTPRSQGDEGRLGPRPSRAEGP